MMSKQATVTPKPWSGWLYTNPDTGTELSTNHPVRSGECPGAADIRPATREALRDELLKTQAALAERGRQRDAEPESAASAASAADHSAVAGSLDDLAVRQIMADVDRATVGRRRVDIAHALLTIVGQEVAANAGNIRELKGRAYQVAKDLKAYARKKWGDMERQKVARPDPSRQKPAR